MPLPADNRRVVGRLTSHQPGLAIQYRVNAEAQSRIGDDKRWLGADDPEHENRGGNGFRVPTGD